MIDLFHSESFWVSVAFFIFIALSFKKGKRLLLTSLDSRIENIVKNINDAKKIRSDAENNLKEVEKNLNQLKTNKKKIIIEAKNESEILKKEILALEKIAIERLHDRLSDRIRQTTNEAITDIKNTSLNIAIKSVKDFLKNQDDGKEKNNLIAESIINLSKDQKEKNKTNYKNL